MNDDYWTHNTAYHSWIISQAKAKNRVIDIGCGDGLLIQRLSSICNHVIGIDTHAPSIEQAKQRLSNNKNATVINIGFEDYVGSPNSFDLIIFVASLHHMNLEHSVSKAKGMLAPHGKLLVVGCASPHGFIDYIIEIARVLPARLGSHFRGEKKGGEIGVPTTKPTIGLIEIKRFSKRELPGVRIRRGLYFRYLLSWDNIE